ncbi:MAG: Trk system potassium transporter TrkA [bacterium]|nr:Trk system potassium transporter TrkA [bacterium]
MKIIIVGGGTMGLYLTQQLLQESHEITVIENNEKVFETIKETMDVLAVHGDGSDPVVLEPVIEEDTDFILPVTDSDKTNILSSLIAHRFGVKRAIIRINDDDNLMNPLISEEGWIKIINPDLIVAGEIMRLITTPVAEEIELFAGGRVEMLKLTVGDDTPLANKPLNEVEITSSWIFIGHLDEERGFDIPHGETIFRPGDRIIAIGNKKDRAEIERVLGLHSEKVERVIILGGGKIGSYIAEHLQGKGINVRLIELNPFRAERLANELDGVLVFQGDGTSEALLEEVGVEGVDYFVALTKEDEVNILTALLAKDMGALRTVILSRKSQYSPIIEKVGIGLTISPRLCAAGEIIRFLHQKDIMTISYLEGGKGVVLELVVPKEAKVEGKTLKDIKLPRGTLVGAIVRGETLIIPRGVNRLLAGDRLVLFSIPKLVKKLEQIFCSK